MSDAASHVIAGVVGLGLMMLLGWLITLAIIRAVFRINHICKRLDEIVRTLQTQEGKPKDSGPA